MPSASVVICTRGRLTELETCLSSLRELNYSQTEVIVVHNDREDSRVQGTVEGARARYLSYPMRGLSRARNRGARAATGEIVAYIDDDAVAERDWLSALVREFSDERVMAVTGRILPTKVETGAERAFAALGGFGVGDESRRVLDRHDPRWFELACFGGIGNGANMAIRRSIFEQWPGFEERLGAGTSIPGGEEHYAFFNLIDRGFRVVHAPEAVVRHPSPTTMDELRSRATGQMATAAAYALFIFAEQPRYRGQLSRFVFSRAFRDGRKALDKARPKILGRLARMRAYLAGMGIFVNSRRVHRNRERAL